MICMLKALFRHKLINFHGRTSPVRCSASPMYEKPREHRSSQGEAEFPIRYVIKYYGSHWEAEILSRDIKRVSHSSAPVPPWLWIKGPTVAAISDPSSAEQCCGCLILMVYLQGVSSEIHTQT